MPKQARQSIVLFDDVCNLCNRSVNTMLRFDRSGHLRFAPLQSPLGQRILREHDLPPEGVNSFLLLENGLLWNRSSAALRIARRMSGLWPVLFLFMIVPRPLRDAVYDFIAANRYRWFGQRDACALPNPQLRQRLLEGTLE
jgi:predicted DCC family thiol-disulfide oxidoreductase YuxK